MVRPWNLQRAQRSCHAGTSEYVVDGDKRGWPRVGREGGFDPCSGLLGRIPVAVAEQSAEGADREMSHTAIHWSISWTTGRRQPPRSQLLEPLCRPSAVDLDGTKLHVLITSNEVRQPRDLGGELDGLW